MLFLEIAYACIFWILCITGRAVVRVALDLRTAGCKTLFRRRGTLRTTLSSAEFAEVLKVAQEAQVSAFAPLHLCGVTWEELGSEFKASNFSGKLTATIRKIESGNQLTLAYRPSMFPILYSIVALIQGEFWLVAILLPVVLCILFVDFTNTMAFIERAFREKESGTLKHADTSIDHFNLSPQGGAG